MRKKIWKKNSLGGLWGINHPFFVSSRPGRDETTFKASTTHQVDQNVTKCLGFKLGDGGTIIVKKYFHTIFYSRGLKGKSIMLGLIACGTWWDNISALFCISHLAVNSKSIIFPRYVRDLSNDNFIIIDKFRIFLHSPIRLKGRKTTIFWSHRVRDAMRRKAIENLARGHRILSNFRILVP